MTLSVRQISRTLLEDGTVQYENQSTNYGMVASAAMMGGGGGFGGQGLGGLGYGGMLGGSVRDSIRASVFVSERGSERGPPWVDAVHARSSRCSARDRRGEACCCRPTCG